jgi:hypothetical protein
MYLTQRKELLTLNTAIPTVCLTLQYISFWNRTGHRIKIFGSARLEPTDISRDSREQVCSFGDMVLQKDPSESREAQGTHQWSEYLGRPGISPTPRQYSILSLQLIKIKANLVCRQQRKLLYNLLHIGVCFDSYSERDTVAWHKSPVGLAY